MIGIICAMNEQHAIGENGKLPWHCPEDLQHFKLITMGEHVIVGRKTYESLPALHGRKVIVVTRNPSKFVPSKPVFAVAENIAQAIAHARGDAIIIGGSEIYREAYPLCDYMWITRVDFDAPNADAFFPIRRGDDGKFPGMKKVMDEPMGEHARIEYHTKEVVIPEIMKEEAR